MTIHYVLCYYFRELAKPHNILDMKEKPNCERQTTDRQSGGNTLLKPVKKEALTLTTECKYKNADKSFLLGKTWKGCGYIFCVPIKYFRRQFQVLHT